MDNQTWDEYRLRDPSEEDPEERPSQPRRHRPYIKADLEWTRALCHLPGSAMRTGLMIQFIYSLKKRRSGPTNPFYLKPSLRRQFALSDREFWRGLTTLVEEQMIGMIRQRGKWPEVWVIENQPPGTTEGEEKYGV